MKLYLLLLLVFLPSVYASSEAQDAKKSLKALIEPLLQKKVTHSKKALEDFSVEKCEKYKINWMDVILMRKSAAMTYTFKPGCDIEGTINPTLLKPFPVDLKIKNLQHFTRLESENTITSTIESNPVMNLAIRNAKLTSVKGTVKFEADYDVVIDPMNQKNAIKENLGGEIRITEIYGKPSTIKEKIKVE